MDLLQIAGGYEELAGYVGAATGGLAAALLAWRKASLAMSTLWRRLGVDSDDPDGQSLAERVRLTHRLAEGHASRLEALERENVSRTERSNDRAERIAKLEYETEKLRGAKCDSCPDRAGALRPIALGK